MNTTSFFSPSLSERAAGSFSGSSYKKKIEFARRKISTIYDARKDRPLEVDKNVSEKSETELAL